MNIMSLTLEGQFDDVILLLNRCVLIKGRKIDGFVFYS